MKETIKVNAIPENEGILEKIKRKAVTAGNWAKTHWKGLALGAVAIGGGAYMLSRRGSENEDEDRTVRIGTGSGIDYKEAINQAFSDEDGSDIGPDDDEPDEVDEY